ncbi:acetyl-CoA carboxylase carboxyltransferase subunit alpha [Pelagirhabdus alkalitolerans]|uniref:Acetyl-coenzyme A carboxylase carboxyl transferase subunit alpha n=1 Tax=Pelagirhabdus alkalitolerans TaxID=1612202 RepID=A0A1G6HJV6_9BACI|nr:acetyl-CoA carboxylase carboxyltransferase subunit alpha [Pelagirhabdus alkalitolerans]SDB94539.1 acetyl-CoA carboxylase carboxyltransferase subunit alpha [Pelagirhabdus alkalitolerans]
MKHILEFEKPVYDLKAKIDELKEMANASDIDLSSDIQKLETRLKKLEDDIYGQLKTWDRVQIARHPERPTALDYIDYLFEDFIELHGDRQFRDDPAIVSGIALYKNTPVTIVAQQRGKNTKDNLYRNFASPHPEGYRKALRQMQLAEKFNRPIITFIDTKGAHPGKGAEERGQGEAIARNLKEMARLSVPSVSIVIGEGGSGGALGIGLTNHILMLENSTYSVISPEGAASILWKDSAKAKDAAKSLKITSKDLEKLGIIDGIIPEPRGGAHHDLKMQAAHLDVYIEKSLDRLNELSKEEIIDGKWEKYKRIGDCT